MKIKQHAFYFFTAGFLAGVFHLQAADPTNQPTSVQENWQTISNRWSRVSTETIKQSAEKGDFSAKYYLGMSYFFGNHIVQNQDEALRWITNAAGKGFAPAQNGLGRMYEIGDDIPQDYTEAARLYRLAADQGNALAQNNLGNLYWHGQGVPVSAVEAIKWYQKSAEQGEVLGEKNLAHVYAQGASDGVEPNHDLAEEWMRKAVDLNTAEGQYQFGALIRSEMNKELHQDTTRFPAAAEWFRKAAEQGHAKAQYELADKRCDL
jgi:uncharacterized protein